MSKDSRRALHRRPAVILVGLFLSAATTVGFAGTALAGTAGPAAARSDVAAVLPTPAASPNCVICWTGP